MRQFLGGIVVCALAVALVGGCGSGPKLAQVTGKVTVDGAPVPRLQIMFEPQDKSQPSSVGFTQADGTYKLRCSSGEDGAAIGQHIVRVTTIEMDDPSAVPLTIPEKYNTGSQLNYEVKAGDNTIDLQLSRR